VRARPQGWEAIRAEVLARIRAREWAAGALIPNEEVLAAEFGCARATVNRALRDLATAGVLERKRKVGTRVALHPVRKATLDIPVTRLEVEARGQLYAFHLLEQALTPAPVPVASRLGLATAPALLHLRSLHLADGRPYLYEDRWLNPAVLPRPWPDFATVSANEWLVAHVAYTPGRHRLLRRERQCARGRDPGAGTGHRVVHHRPHHLERRRADHLGQAGLCAGLSAAHHAVTWAVLAVRPGLRRGYFCQQEWNQRLVSWRWTMRNRRRCRREGRWRRCMAP